MVIYDESGAKLEEVDYSLGYVETMQKLVVHSYIVDVPEQGHYEVVAEYPKTGGKDVEYRIDVPEQGHWETRDAETGEEVADYDGIIPSDWPREQTVSDTWQYGVYHAYTDEELAALEKAGSDSEEMSARVSSVEEQLTNIQLALASMYEEGLNG